MKKADFIRIRDQLRKNQVPSLIVQTEEEAAAMTSCDLLGHVWKKGEPYYKVEATMEMFL